MIEFIGNVLMVIGGIVVFIVFIILVGIVVDWASPKEG